MGMIVLLKAQEGKYLPAKHWSTDMPITALEYDDSTSTIYAGQEDGMVQVTSVSLPMLCSKNKSCFHFS
jgi:hypothetical protein